MKISLWFKYCLQKTQNCHVSIESENISLLFYLKSLFHLKNDHCQIILQKKIQFDSSFHIFYGFFRFLELFKICQRYLKNKIIEIKKVTAKMLFCNYMVIFSILCHQLNVTVIILWFVHFVFCCWFFLSLKTPYW